MDVNEPHRQEDEAAAIDWLSPSEALAKFNLPDGVRFAGAQQEQPEARVRYGFRIGEIGLLVDPDCGSEVVGMPPISHLPGSPHGFMGLINLRGNLVPIYELRDLLGLGARKTASDLMMLVFGAGESAVGVITEGYPRALASLRPLSSLPQLPEALRDHVSAGYVQDEIVWLEFNHTSFFDEACRGIRRGITTL